MKNHKTVFLLITAGFLAAPAFADTAEKKLQDNTAIAEPGRGNFEEDVSDAAARMQETLDMMRKDKFFLKLDKIIDNGEIKNAEELLGKQVKDIPAYKDTGAYIVAKSKIAYAKGDYQTAYAEADKFIGELEKFFAPQKPYEAVLKDKNDRDTVCYAYILRYQAVVKLLRYEDALSDLDRALRIEATPGLLHAKMGTLFVMNRYAEAANVSDKAYDMDKTIFVSSPYRNHYCWVFSEQGVKAKDCSYFAALARERAEKENAAKSQKDLH